MPTIQRLSQSHRRRILAAPEPYQAALDLDPIAFWPMDETEGTTITCLINPDQNGAYIGSPSLAADTAPDSQPCPVFGANQYGNLLTGALIASFNGTELTIAIWMKFNNAAYWTDGTWHCSQMFYGDGNDNAYAPLKTNSNNELLGLYYGGAQKQASTTDYGGSTSWIHSAITASLTADQVKVYLDGSQIGTTQTGLGTWNHDLTAAQVGAWLGMYFWNGSLARLLLYDYALSPTQIATLAAT